MKKAPTVPYYLEDEDEKVAVLSYLRRKGFNATDPGVYDPQAKEDDRCGSFEMRFRDGMERPMINVKLDSRLEIALDDYMMDPEN